MNLALNDAQAEELHLLLEHGLRELSHEIAATDNALYRVDLVERRRLLADVSSHLRELRAVPVAATDTGEALERELARPGD
ncbi:MAG: hypothetical protein KGJ77_07840 [Acidobacteriota bacterium]|nr:hypothetical protein [Acidobacteriota bacterium]